MFCSKITVFVDGLNMELVEEDQFRTVLYEGMDIENTDGISTLFMILEIWKPSSVHSQWNALLIQFLSNMALALYGMGGNAASLPIFSQ